MWVKLDDHFDDHPKIAGLSDGAFRLHVSALTYCARKDTEGRIARSVLLKLQPRTPAKFAAELVAARVWHDVGHDCAECVQPEPGECVIHNFLMYNPLTEAARERRKAKARKAAQARWGNRQAPEPDATEHAPSMPGECLEMPPLPVTDVYKSVETVPEGSAQAVDNSDRKTKALKIAAGLSVPLQQAEHEYGKWVDWSQANRHALKEANWRKCLNRVQPEPAYVGPPPARRDPVSRCGVCGDPLVDGPAGAYCFACGEAPTLKAVSA